MSEDISPGSFGLVCELLSGVVSDIESRFPVGKSTVAYRSVTGEPYVTFSCGAFDCELDEVRLLSDSQLPDKAIEFFVNAFNSYASERNGALYWRLKPQLIKKIGHDKSVKKQVTWYGVRARLLISDKPPNGT